MNASRGPSASSVGYRSTGSAEASGNADGGSRAEGPDSPLVAGAIRLPVQRFFHPSTVIQFLSPWPCSAGAPPTRSPASYMRFWSKPAATSGLSPFTAVRKCAVFRSACAAHTDFDRQFRSRIGRDRANIRTCNAPKWADALVPKPSDQRAYKKISAANAKDRQDDDPALVAALRAIALEPKAPKVYLQAAAVHGHWNKPERSKEI